MTGETIQGRLLIKEIRYANLLSTIDPVLVCQKGFIYAGIISEIAVENCPTLLKSILFIDFLSKTSCSQNMKGLFFMQDTFSTYSTQELISVKLISVFAWILKVLDMHSNPS